MKQLAQSTWIRIIALDVGWSMNISVVLEAEVEWAYQEISCTWNGRYTERFLYWGIAVKQLSLKQVLFTC